MLIKIKKDRDVNSSEITSESIYRERRQFLKTTGLFALAGAGVAASPISLAADEKNQPENRGTSWLKNKISQHTKSGYSTNEKLTPYNDVTGYNNFYEFGTGKNDPARYAGNLVTNPWSVTIEGEVAKPGVYTLEDILKPHALEERIYRLRCVEAWSMVIPWLGFPLADLLKRVEPGSKARFVEFTTLYDPEQMPGQKSRFNIIKWPYIEGLRIDEAMNPLTFLAVGLYGKELPNQNGAPIRLVVPWKYGFKSIKSIVKIRLTEQQPKTSWETIAPNEYGFYANVNPEVNHPRWSQKSERRLPGSLFSPNRIETQMFNGYGDEVAGLYKGMDLNANF